MKMPAVPAIFDGYAERVRSKLPATRKLTYHLDKRKKP
jgi:hypothetical protein